MRLGIVGEAEKQPEATPLTQALAPHQVAVQFPIGIVGGFLVNNILQKMKSERGMNTIALSIAEASKPNRNTAYLPHSRGQR